MHSSPSGRGAEKQERWSVSGSAIRRVNEDLQLVAVHTHINLVGWASLALFGVIYRLYPELAASRLALVHFWLSAPSAVVFPVGINLAQVHQIHAVVIATSLLWLLGALVFFVVVARLASLRSSSASVIPTGR